MTEASHAAWWYWGPFLAAFAFIGFWETFAPLRESPVSTPRRWLLNASLMAVSNVAQVVLLRSSPGLIALASTSSSIGLMPKLHWPPAAQWLLTILLLDLIRYLQHWLMHRIGLLWRIHQVHHADPHYDMTTGLRFHPLEGVLVNGSYLAAIALLAPPVAAVLAVEAAAAVQSLFAHANSDLAASWERWVRRLWVTPTLHRVHHSADPLEQNRNFGMLFPLWDRLFGTYLAASALPARTMPIGLDSLPPSQASHFFSLLALPFRRTSPARTPPARP